MLNIFNYRPETKTKGEGVRLDVWYINVIFFDTVEITQLKILREERRFF